MAKKKNRAMAHVLEAMKPSAYGPVRMGNDMLDAVASGVCCLDHYERLVHANPAFCHAYGYTLEELFLRPFSDLLHPQEDKVSSESSGTKSSGRLFDDALATGRKPLHCLHKSGEALIADLVFSPIVSTEASLPLVMVTITKMSSLTAWRKRSWAQDPEIRFHTLFERAPFSIQLINMAGETTLVNQAWYDLWRVPKYKFEEEGLKEFNVLDDPQLKALGLQTHIKRAFSGESVVVPPVYYEPAKLGLTGRPRWVRGHFHPIKDEDGRMREVMLIHHDVTDEIKSQIKLTKAKEAAESANRAKSTFLANMSHEIRTPLTAILSFVRMLKEEQVTEQEQSYFFEVIDRNGEHLQRLIDDVLDLSKLETNSLKVEKSAIRIADLTKETNDLFSQQAKNMGLRLSLQIEPEVPEFIVTDPDRLRQILNNLIGNAIKFTNQGGVSVRVACHPSHNILEIAIRDTGIGILEVDQEVLFQPFKQVDSTSTRKYGGTGLGLALSRRLARAIGGEVTLIESKPGFGSTFLVSLPLVEGRGVEKRIG